MSTNLTTIELQNCNQSSKSITPKKSTNRKINENNKNNPSFRLEMSKNLATIDLPNNDPGVQKHHISVVAEFPRPTNRYLFSNLTNLEIKEIKQKHDHHADQKCGEIWQRLVSRTVTETSKSATWLLRMFPLIDGRNQSSNRRNPKIYKNPSTCGPQCQESSHDCAAELQPRHSKPPTMSCE